MDKRLIYPNYNVDGVRNTYDVTEDRQWLRKTAGVYHPVIQEYIEKAKPLPNLIQVFMTALGAHPQWPVNANGDLFPEPALKHEGPDYGYQTFMTNANYFTHHVNQDPALAKGKVLLSAWNDKAKRVELIVGIDPNKDPDAGTMLSNGESLCFSMGAKLPFDVCTVCSNRAKTRGEYCDHLRYQMNQFDPGTGILVAAINPFPKFFDISRVLIPADKTAYMWEKVASASNPLSKLGSAELAELPAGRLADMKFLQEKVAEKTEAAKAFSARKIASVSKKAEIKKQIPAIGNSLAVEKLKLALSQVKEAMNADAPSLSADDFKGAGLSQIVSTMLMLGISPTPTERRTLYDLFVKEDGKLPACHISPTNLHLGFLRRLAPVVQERSCYRPLLIRRLAVVKIPAVPEPKTALASAPGAGKAIFQGVMTALGSVFGIGPSLAPTVATQAQQMSTGMAGLIEKYPVLAGLIGAVLLNKVFPGPGARPPMASGNFVLADPTRGFYNTNWQRRFHDMQNRPVTVIKTGAAENEASLLWGHLPYLFLTVDFEKTATEQCQWDALADQFLQTAPQAAKLLSELQKMDKTAGIENEEVHFSFPELGDLYALKLIFDKTK